MLKIGDYGLKLTFLNVIPGQEQIIESEIEQNVKKQYSFAKSYKCFGSNDLIVINTWHNIETINDINYCIGYNALNMKEEYLYGFNDGNNKILNEGLFNRNFIGIIYLKLFKPALFKYGIIFYKDILKIINKYFENTNFFGCLGWNDIVITYHRDELHNVFNEITKIEKVLNENISKKIKNEFNSLIEDSYSIIGINYEIIRNKEFEKLGEKIGKNSNIKIRLKLKTKYSNIAKVTKILEKNKVFVDKEIFLGNSDILINNIDTSLGEYIKELLRIRREHHNLIVDTITEISGINNNNNNIEDDTETTIKYIPPKFEIDYDGLNLLKNIDYSIYLKFRKFLVLANEFAIDELSSDIFFDMVNFVNKINNSFKNILKTNKKDINIIKKAIEAFNFGFTQRKSGVIGYHEEKISSYSVFPLGLQKIIMSSEFIPYKLLKNLGSEWVGFNTFGLTERFCRYEFGILNLPIKTLFNSKDWWGLIHETGHEHANINESIEKFYEENKEIFKFELGIQNFNELYDEYFDQIFMALWEFYSDIFSLLFYFFGDIEEYLSKISATYEEFINSKSANVRAIVESFLIRISYVYHFYHKYLAKKQISVPKSDFFEDFINKKILIIDTFKKNCPKKTIQSTIRSIYKFLTFSDDLCQDLLMKYLEMKKKFDSKKIDKQYNALKDGEIIPDIEYPSYIIYKMNKDSNSSFRLSITTIISFWFSFIKQYYKKFYKTS